ncbi:Arc family DNA-binding protein [Pseudomonas sp. URMO17WK12:I2]|uniref:Arc family DNA-binding protein n=1 Tax=Pseudomonas sp. URMO17WK12:I2 TaxID=1261623 RepID=UPI000DAC0074|nr:Arc family DNA-binding protein [Pseudomonas sp. URMO17WK12:I2]PZW49720.1 Arc-like DNA binding dprotein [Pseudomonas sp. URMO17WK12:I2]
MSRMDSRTADKFVVRLPDGLRGKIFDVSGENQRSMNGEIVYRLEQSLRDDQVIATQAELIKLLTRRVGELEESLSC